jgi:hypothetical protein
MTVVAAWMLSCVALGIAVRMTAGRPDSVPVAVLALPMVLFIVVAPVPVESIQAIRAFQAIAYQGGSVDRSRVVDLATGMLEPFRTALWLSASVLVAGVALTLNRRTKRCSDGGPGSAGSPLQRGGWMVLSCAAATGVVVALLWFVAGVPALVMEAGEAFAGATTAAGARLTPGQYAEAISARLMVGVIGGGSVALLAFLLGALGIATAGRARRTPLSDVMSWPMVIVVSVLLAAGLVSVARALDRYASLAAP